VLLAWWWLGYILADVDAQHAADESLKYEVGADAAGMLAIVPGGLSLAWIFLCVTILASRAVLRQPVLTSSLQWHLVAFGGVTALGILGCCGFRLVAARAGYRRAEYV